MREKKGALACCLCVRGAVGLTGFGIFRLRFGIELGSNKTRVGWVGLDGGDLRKGGSERIG